MQSLATQEIYVISCNLEVSYRIHKSSQLSPILSQINLSTPSKPIKSISILIISSYLHLQSYVLLSGFATELIVIRFQFLTHVDPTTSNKPYTVGTNMRRVLRIIRKNLLIEKRNLSDIKLYLKKI